MKTSDDCDRCDSGSDLLFSSEFSFALMFSCEAGDTGGPCSLDIAISVVCSVSLLQALFSCCSQVRLSGLLVLRPHTDMPLYVFPLRSLFLKNILFFSSSATKWSWPRHASPDPAVEKLASEHQRAGHLGGLVWIKSCFSVSPPAPPSQGRGHGSRRAAPELITQRCCRRDHTPRYGGLRREFRGPGSALQEFHAGRGEGRRRGWRGRVWSLD